MINYKLSGKFIYRGANPNGWRIPLTLGQFKGLFNANDKDVEGIPDEDYERIIGPRKLTSKEPEKRNFKEPEKKI